MCVCVKERKEKRKCERECVWVGEFMGYDGRIRVQTSKTCKDMTGNLLFENTFILRVLAPVSRCPRLCQRYQ